jgi:hypothetical protein
METKIIEATNAEGGGGINHGKFLVGRFTEDEWNHQSPIEGPGLLTRRYGRHHLLVLDLEAAEGAIFAHGGYAKADLNKHPIYVCPMFEPFLTWLYQQDVDDLQALPDVVRFTEDEAPSAMWGYRRPGPTSEAPSTECPSRPSTSTPSTSTCGSEPMPEAS